MVWLRLPVVAMRFIQTVDIHSLRRFTWLCRTAYPRKLRGIYAGIGHMTKSTIVIVNGNTLTLKFCSCIIGPRNKYLFA